MGNGSFLAVKQLGRGVEHPSHLAPRLKKEYSYNFILLMGLHGLFLIYLFLHMLFTASWPHKNVMYFIVNSIDSFSLRNVLRLGRQTIQIDRNFYSTGIRHCRVTPFLLALLCTPYKYFPHKTCCVVLTQTKAYISSASLKSNFWIWFRWNLSCNFSPKSVNFYLDVWDSVGKMYDLLILMTISVICVQKKRVFRWNSSNWVRKSFTVQLTHIHSLLKQLKL